MENNVDSITLLKEMVDKTDIFSVSKEEASDRYYFFKGISILFPKLETEYHSAAIALTLYYGRKAGLYSDSIKYMETEYKTYVKAHPCDYFGQSKILYEWAHNLEIAGQHEKALKKTSEAVVRNLMDNVTYQNYEFLSFRRCSKYAFKEIEEEKLTMMHPSQFNDPMDTVLIQWLKNQEENATDEVERAIAQNNLNVLKNLRVRCFSRTARLPYHDSEEDVLKLREHKQQDVCAINPLMWAHYADNHKGICICYRFTRDMFPLRNKNMSEIFRFGNIDYQRNFSINEFDVTIKDALFAKSNVWKYEKETRLVYLSYGRVPQVKKVPVPGAIKAIYLGLRCSKEDEVIIRKLINGRNIKLYRMYTDTNNVYELKTQKLQ